MFPSDFDTILNLV
nr:unnamed protein product [Callosobruchus analis]